jgi:hypothetical protein
MPIRRIVIDTAHVRGATTPSRFQANLANDLREVSKVSIVDVSVTMPPISGIIRLDIKRANVTATSEVDIRAGYYDNSFASFKDHVIDAMTTVLYAKYGGEAVFDRELDRFVLSDTAPTRAAYSNLSIIISNKALADLIGWSSPSTVESASGILHLPSFRAYAWPRVPPPVYIHIAQMRTEHQAATGIVVVEERNGGGTTMMTPESLSGVASSLTHVVPSHGGTTLTHGGGVRDELVFDRPISSLRRLDVRVCTADGVAYETPRVFIVMDAHCDGRVY